MTNGMLDVKMMPFAGFGPLSIFLLFQMKEPWIACIILIEETCNLKRICLFFVRG